jgi:DMSO/TMAO reductase YedYZ molybdopterin-dependent catalytic subunit
LERTILMICPGFFANNGKWKGVSVRELLARAESRAEVTHITFRGPTGTYGKVLRVPIEHIRSDQVFLAYEVNGQALPKKHGFPLRLVAEGYYGYDWIKYVDKVEAEIIKV